MTLAETIQQATREHLANNNGLLFGQCVTAVGWIVGTVPEMSEEEGIVELSMADVAGAGVAVGAALMGVDQFTSSVTKDSCGTTPHQF